MELKDMILSTLAELEVPKEDEKKTEISSTSNINIDLKESEEVEKNTNDDIKLTQESETNSISCASKEDERHFCESMRERILVLFEGFQSPNNKSIEAKIDLTLNFLEYLLAVVDERLENLDKK